jgi:hypothetical protein
VRKSLLQQLLLESRLGQLGVDGGLNRFDELDLLGFTLLLLVTNPRVEDGLELGLEGDLLLEGEVFVLDLVDLLREWTTIEGTLNDKVASTFAARSETHLGDSVKLLGQWNDVLQLSNRVDSLGDGLSVLLAGRVEDILDALFIGCVKALVPLQTS